MNCFAFHLFKKQDVKKMYSASYFHIMDCKFS